jgi:uncharacterized protein (DUF1778 family)
VSSPSKTIRLTTEEDRVLRRASELLDQPTSQLVQAGVVEAAHRLGYFAGVLSVPGPYAGPWPDLPDRGDESTSKRTSITFDPQTVDLLERAAKHVDVGESFFMLGATFRYLANLRRTDPRVRRLKLPTKYERSS